MFVTMQFSFCIINNRYALYRTVLICVAYCCCALQFVCVTADKQFSGVVIRHIMSRMKWLLYVFDDQGDLYIGMGGCL